MRLLVFTFAFLAALTFTVAAQDEDGGSFLERTIEDLLSGEGRDVTIRGFSGALSSEASFDVMTISDPSGDWLTLRDVKLNWQRTALLRGRLQVRSLTAATLEIPRLPDPVETIEVPDAEASGFSLPELPVSVNIADFEIGRISLGEEVMGIAAELNLRAAAQLDDEGAVIDLTADRIDDAQGEFVIRASFLRENEAISVDIEIDEGEDGLVANTLNLPDRPTVYLAVKGEGPLDDFTADIALSTADQPRLTGAVSLAALEGTGTDDTPDRRVLAEISGDVRPLIPQEYWEFFGSDIDFVADTVLAAGGEVDVSAFSFGADSVSLDGSVRLNSDKWPDFIDIDGRIFREGEPVLLPGSGDGMTVGDVKLSVDYDAAQDNALLGVFDILSLVRDEVSIGRTQLTLDGSLDAAPGSIGELFTDLEFTATDVRMTDPSVARALGDRITGRASIDYIEDGPIEVVALNITGADYGLGGEITVEGLQNGFPTTVNLAVSAGNIGRFEALAGRSLGGSVDVKVKGRVTPLAGTFDLNVAGTTEDIAVDIPQADAVLTGLTELSVTAVRDSTGTFVRDLVLKNDALDVTADVALDPGESVVTARAALADIGLVLPQYEGAVVFDGSASESANGWRVDADLDAPYDGTLTVAGLATGPDADLRIDLSLPDVAPLVPDITGSLTANGRVWQSPEGYRVDFAVAGPYDAEIAAEGLATGPDADVGLRVSVPDLEPLVPDITGALQADGRVFQSPEGYRVEFEADGPYEARAAIEGLATGPDAELDIALSMPDVQPLVPSVSGPVDADARVWQTPGGYRVDVKADGPYAAKVAVEGLATGPDADLNIALSLPDVQPLVPSVTGPVDADARVWQTPDGYRVDVTADGPYEAKAAIEGLATGPDADLDITVSLPDVQPLVPSVSGPLAADARVWQTATGYRVDVTADGPYEAKAAIKGLATGPDTDLTVTVSVPEVKPLLPAVSGPAKADARLWLTEDGYRVDLDADGPSGANALVSGLATGPDADLTFEAAIPDLSVLVPELPGPFDVAGTARRQSEGWQVDTSANGPAGSTAVVAGLVRDNGNLDLTASGSAPLGLSQPFLAPRSLLGQARFDLAVEGPPALSSVTGRIETSDARFSAPNLRIGLEDLRTTIALSGGSARIDAETRVAAGGRIVVNGAVNLTSLAADLSIGLRGTVLTDPRLYTTTLNGDVTVNGPLTGGARIDGTINIDGVEVTVPSTGVTSIGAIPDIRHIGAPAPVNRTRARAGVIPQETTTRSAAGPAYPLSITVNAPSQIFVRGRGVNAELGGSLEITGNTNNIISAGSFDLIRGRLDIIAKRFDLDEGTIDFQGSLVPYIRFVSTTEIPDGTGSIIIEGPADALEFEFTSNPEYPPDEVLSLIIFGRYVSEISGFQALQLANGIAELTGRGGVGVFGRLRTGIGLDELDVSTSESGDTKVTAGKYLTDDIYTDVTTSAEEGTDISINIDLTESLKGRATVGSEGQSSIGLFFERDY